jgi:hypothetical protein
VTWINYSLLCFDSPDKFTLPVNYCACCHAVSWFMNTMPDGTKSSYQRKEKRLVRLGLRMTPVSLPTIYVGNLSDYMHLLGAFISQPKLHERVLRDSVLFCLIYLRDTQLEKNMMLVPNFLFFHWLQAHVKDVLKRPNRYC